MFAQDHFSHTSKPFRDHPHFFAAANEGAGRNPDTKLNSGVMFMNVEGMDAAWGEMLAAAQEKKWRFALYDQDLLQFVFGGNTRENITRRWESLPVAPCPSQASTNGNYADHAP